MSDMQIAQAQTAQAPAPQAQTPYGAIAETRTLKLASVFVDAAGDSYFGEVDTVQAGGARGGERIFDLSAWQVWETKPGFVADFKPVAEPQALAVMAGRLEVTVSTGEKRFFSRGDIFLLQDVSGTGHAVRTIGSETASVMLMTLRAPVT